MRKRMLLTILSASLLAGCSLQSDVDEQYESRIDTYQTYYTEVLGNGHYEEESEYFSLSYEMTEVEGDGYRYYVILDEPVIAKRAGMEKSTAGMQ